jgi:hypothetical protein
MYIDVGKRYDGAVKDGIQDVSKSFEDVEYLGEK